MKIKIKEVVVFSAMCLLFVMVVWMMFQPLMSAYSDGMLVEGPIYVYGISFLNEFGSQGVLTVVFPFLLLLVAVSDTEAYRKSWTCSALTFAGLLAYVRSLAYAKQWLCTEVSWAIKYHMGAIAYPAVMIAFMGLVIFWINQYDSKECVDEEEEV